MDQRGSLDVDIGYWAARRPHRVTAPPVLHEQRRWSLGAGHDAPAAHCRLSALPLRRRTRGAPVADAGRGPHRARGAPALARASRHRHRVGRVLGDRPGDSGRDLRPRRLGTLAGARLDGMGCGVPARRRRRTRRLEDRRSGRSALRGGRDDAHRGARSARRCHCDCLCGRARTRASPRPCSGARHGRHHRCVRGVVRRAPPRACRARCRLARGSCIADRGRGGHRRRRACEGSADHGRRTRQFRALHRLVTRRPGRRPRRPGCVGVVASTGPHADRSRCSSHWPPVSTSPDSRSGSGSFRALSPHARSPPPGSRSPGPTGIAGSPRSSRAR